MRDVDVPVRVFVEIEIIIAEHIQPGHHQQDPEEALVRGQTFQTVAARQDERDSTLLLLHRSRNTRRRNTD
jgi:hypothetical protein